MTDLDAWVPLAEIARPHGVRGELRLRLFNKDSDALLGQDEVLVRTKDGEEHEVSVDRARRADDAILMKLHSVDSRDKADELRGALVCVRRRDFAPPGDGEFYAVDIAGAEVRVHGERLGEAAEIIDYPTVQTMLVRADDGLGDWEIPLTETYVGKVDTTARVVEVLTLDELERAAPKKPKKEKEKRSWGKNWRKDNAEAEAPSTSGAASTSGAEAPPVSGAASTSGAEAAPASGAATTNEAATASGAATTKEAATASPQAVPQSEGGSGSEREDGS